MAHMLTDHVQVEKPESHNCTLNRLWRSYWRESRTRCYWTMPMVSRGTWNPRWHQFARHCHASEYVKITYIMMIKFSEDFNFCIFYTAVPLGWRWRSGLLGCVQPHFLIRIPIGLLSLRHRQWHPLRRTWPRMRWRRWRVPKPRQEHSRCWIHCGKEE